MAIITVTSTADSGAGSLRQAISDANDGDVIRLGGSLSNKKITLTSGQLVLGKSIVIDGRDAPGVTISGNNSTRVFQVEKNKNVTLDSIRVADGVSGGGGGIYARQSSSLTLKNVRVENNTSEIGGGLRVGFLAKATIIDSIFEGNNGTLTANKAGFSAGAISADDSRAELSIKGTTFRNNKGFNGGAIYARSTVSFEIIDSIFENNSGLNKEGGGAVFTDGVNPFGPSDPTAGGKLIVRNSRFENNQTEGGGGALYLFGYGGDRAFIEGSVFVGNSSSNSDKGLARGGAIEAKMALTIKDSSFINNTATKQGGAIWYDSKLPGEILNSTFSGNKVNSDAGGAMFLNTVAPVGIINSTIVYNSAGRANGALWYNGKHSVTLTNSIVAFNTATDRRQNQVGYQAFDGGGNVEFSPDSKSLRVLANSLVADPKLGDLQNSAGTWFYPLQSDSPAIGAGIQSKAPETDQRRFLRDSAADVGAFEFGATSTSTGGDVSSDPIPELSPTPEPTPEPEPIPKPKPAPEPTSEKPKLLPVNESQIDKLGTNGNSTPDPKPTSKGPKLLPINESEIDVLGTDGNDTIEGKFAAEVIVALDGNDTVYGKGQGDRIYGGGGDDTIDGGTGKDVLYGGLGNDELYGKIHSDILVGVDPGSNDPGKGEVDKLVGGHSGDIFVVGDESGIYYSDGNGNTGGESDYAYLDDFKDFKGDQIQLHGNASEYELMEMPLGVGIYYTTETTPELIAVVEDGDINRLSNGSSTSGGGMALNDKSGAFIFV